MVEEPNTTSYRTQSATVEYDKSTVAVDAENITYTQRKMEEAFFGGDTPLFARGDGMTVRYRYIGFEEGSQVGRYLTAGIAGGSKIVMEVDFVGPDGQLLAQVRSEGSVSGGFFGGSNKTGIDKAVKKAADYASSQFK
ncbi:hypothetical protein FSZ31_04240 [Sphingorhabdus soli]|uniref:DUF4410 domain-containing protein n=1 Tax=Flavisphingopyxis soli TaxID=2601267 RepID=A0A5C6ULT5_9SPHN|nr:hypothetical protein [Sphingorhabdus soli]TXC73937.1 hypothetical protein FSZ31_04240 [Sphingorhabdus soli]